MAGQDAAEAQQQAGSSERSSPGSTDDLGREPVPARKKHGPQHACGGAQPPPGDVRPGMVQGEEPKEDAKH
jgi:hypothetical protein